MYTYTCKYITYVDYVQSRCALSREFTECQFATIGRTREDKRAREEEGEKHERDKTGRKSRGPIIGIERRSSSFIRALTEGGIWKIRASRWVK